MHRNKKLIWRLFPYHVLILLTAVLAVVWFGSLTLRELHITRMTTDLKVRTKLMEPMVANLLRQGNFAALEKSCRETGVKVATRITVVDPQGRVLCDSEHDPRTMGNHADRSEIALALAGNVGTARRYSATLRTEMLYVAAPVYDGPEKRIGVIRTALPFLSIDRQLRGLKGQIAAITLVVVTLAAGLTLVVTRKDSQPLVEIKRGAERFASGQLGCKIAVSGSEEIVALAQAMNTMAAQLDDRIRTVLKQRNEFETIFATMMEGVMTIDAQERLISLNEAAARMLRIDSREAAGRNLLETVRNADLLHFIRQALTGDRSMERTIVLSRGRDNERVLQIYGARLAVDEERRAGALIVMNDVTRLLQLENVRRDFVANVSHELKTPITSIKGYVETLLDDDTIPPRQARDFLEIILKQANRLHAIVEDILTLSRIEEDAARETIELEPGLIREVLLAAIENCLPRAVEKNIEITLQCPDDLQGRVNRPLLEQAVLNLINNGVNYSRPESVVTVRADRAGEKIRIAVNDSGIGIAEEHQTRIFERFYLVDKARGRKLGGTGLGLAIVKHIVAAHGGEIKVESSPGKGSTFTILIPA